MDSSADPEMAGGLYNRAVVAASYQTNVLNSHPDRPAVCNSKLGSADEHSEIA